MKAPVQAASLGGTANFAFGAIILAFIVYITAKGELAQYIQLFFYATPQVPVTGAAQSQTIPSPIPGNPGLATGPGGLLNFGQSPFGIGGPSWFQNLLGGSTPATPPPTTTPPTTGH